MLFRNRALAQRFRARRRKHRNNGQPQQTRLNKHNIIVNRLIIPLTNMGAYKLQPEQKQHHCVNYGECRRASHASVLKKSRRMYEAMFDVRPSRRPASAPTLPGSWVWTPSALCLFRRAGVETTKSFVPTPVYAFQRDRPTAPLVSRFG